MSNINFLRELIDCAMGRMKPDVVIRDVSIINVFSEEIIEGSILIKNGHICGVSEQPVDAKITFNGKKMYAAPAFIDAHIHVESSLLNLTEFAKTVIPHGTGSIISDFHELANVLGLKGLKLIIDEAKRLPLKVFIAAPSCVPAAPGIDTSGATLDTQSLSELIGEDRVIALGEVMNYVGVINGEEDVLSKINLFYNEGKIIDGHAPLLRGSQLQAYVATGISTDHETVDPGEALEKIRSGMFLLVRQGSVAKNIGILRELLDNGIPLERIAIVSDDVHVDELIEVGHMEPKIKELISMGVDPIKAIKTVTINPATHYGLRRLGAIAPGYSGDIVLMGNINSVDIHYIFLDGKLVAKERKLTIDIGSYSYPRWALDTFHVRGTISADDLAVKAKGNSALVNVIVAKEGSIITDKTQIWLEIRDNKVMPDTKRDVLPIVVVERHKGAGNIGKGFVTGFELKRGAIASSVAHDSHNIVGVGTNYIDLAIAINSIINMKGGLVVVENEKAIASLDLRLAGLMSTDDAITVSKKLVSLKKVAENTGTKLENPFMLLSFMALPVIPKLKITDKGLFDVEQFRYINPIEKVK